MPGEQPLRRTEAKAYFGKLAPDALCGSIHF